MLAIAAGAAATHTMVPPTPGPLAVAANLGVDVGLLMLVGLVVAAPASVVGLFVSTWLDRKLRIEYRPLPGAEAEAPPFTDDKLPPLSVSLLPIALPVVLIAGNSVISTVATHGVAIPPGVVDIAALVGNPNFALLVSAIVALGLVQVQCHPTRDRLAHMVEQSLMSGGVIILITAAGGAFGTMLRSANVGCGVEALLGSSHGSSVNGLSLLLVAALMSTVFKIAQGSSTVAMITTSAMIAAMLPSGAHLAFHPVYLAPAIAGGSLIGTWMNDSGFWIFAKMGNLTEAETLKSWTILSASVGLTGILVTCLLALVFPMAPRIP